MSYFRTVLLFLVTVVVSMCGQSYALDVSSKNGIEVAITEFTKEGNNIKLSYMVENLEDSDLWVRYGTVSDQGFAKYKKIKTGSFASMELKTKYSRDFSIGFYREDLLQNKNCCKFQDNKDEIMVSRKWSDKNPESVIALKLRDEEMN